MNKKGTSCEVHPLYSKEEVKSMIGVFNKHIENATTETNRRLWHRNLAIFVVGTNLGLRASDLVRLKYSFFIEDVTDEGIAFRKGYSLRPKKTQKTKKIVKLHFNMAVIKTMREYIEAYPFESLDDYAFPSREGDSYITEKSLWRIIKNVGKEAGIEQSLGSHTLRKTTGRMIYNEAVDKEAALVLLSQIFNHSSTAITRAYIGLTNDDIANAFDSINIGYEYL